MGYPLSLLRQALLLTWSSPIRLEPLASEYQSVCLSVCLFVFPVLGLQCVLPCYSYYFFSSGLYGWNSGIWSTLLTKPFPQPPPASCSWGRSSCPAPPGLALSTVVQAGNLPPASSWVLLGLQACATMPRFPLDDVKGPFFTFRNPFFCLTPSMAETLGLSVCLWLFFFQFLELCVQISSINR